MARMQCPKCDTQFDEREEIRVVSCPGCRARLRNPYARGFVWAGYQTEPRGYRSLAYAKRGDVPPGGGKVRKKKNRVLHAICFAISIIICLFFSFILICNLIFITKSEIYPDKAPAVFGVIPMVVCSGSMSGERPDSIEVDDLIIVVNTDMEKMQTGDIIAFYDDTIVVSHRIIDIQTTEEGERLLYTKGDANNVAEENPVTADNFIGKVWVRIPRIGAFILFLQRPLGLILFGVLPLSVALLLSFMFGKKKSEDDKEQ